jgi:tetratricopeptide (TPR) repeat protein
VKTAVTLFAIVGVAALAGAGTWFALRAEPDAPPRDPEPAPVLPTPYEPSQRRAIGVPEDAPATAIVGTAEWVRLNNDGVDALGAERIDDAIGLFERALAAALATDPDRTEDWSVLRSNLAEALARRAIRTWDAGEHAAAIEDLARAVELDPDRDDLVRLLERWRQERAVEEAFASYSSQRFEIVFDGERAALLTGGAQRAIDVLEGAYGELWLFFGHDPVVVGGERIGVAFYTPEQFRDITGLGHWAGGAYDGRIRVPIEDFDGDEARWTQTLWHELTHAFLHDLIDGGPPGWLDEGLAQWLEPSHARDLERARATLTSEALLPLASLEGTFSGLSDAALIRRAYAQALVFTDYLVRTFGEYVLREMLGALASGADMGARFEELVGFSLDTALGDLGDELDRE